MASPSNRMITGSFTAAGADQTVDLPGFRPLKVELFGANGVSLMWHSGMADDSAWKTVAAGDRTLITTNGITPNAYGFDLGADAGINTGSQSISFIAFG